MNLGIMLHLFFFTTVGVANFKPAMIASTSEVKLSFKFPKSVPFFEYILSVE